MAERRRTERRKATEKLRSGSGRRRADRRDSPRVRVVCLVRPTGAKGAWDLQEGELSLGGIFCKSPAAAQGKNVEVRFRLPSIRREVRAFGEVLRLKEAGQNLGSHIRFTYLDFESELAIARYLQNTSRS